MKHLIISIFTGVALASAALAQVKQDDNNTSTTAVHRGSSRGNAPAQVAPVSTRQVTRTAPIRTQRSVSTAPLRTHTDRGAARFNRNATVRSGATANAQLRERHANTTVRSHIAGNTRVRDRNPRFNDQARVRSNVTVNRDRNFRNRTFSGTTTTNVAVNRNRNVTVTNNWRGSRFSGQQYAAFRNYHRQWHDRGWWTSHYNRIIFVGGGWYFWNAGYWYPAWGYDPYAYYPYDGPIYGYGNLTPDQIVVEVQTQLQRDGYYAGPIDGVLGRMTRQAIATFQADHGLAITSTVDEPTLSTLGLS
jgi:Putative peptidoglycan binding domain